jgi:hypothetical protein
VSITGLSPEPDGSFIHGASEKYNAQHNLTDVVETYLPWRMPKKFGSKDIHRRDYRYDKKKLQLLRNRKCVYYL